MRLDSRGRVRRIGQERGLRPLHPRLPGGFCSRLLRAAMSIADWRLFDDLTGRARAAGEPTDARAHGAALAALLREFRRSAANPVVLWLDWEMEKSRRLVGIRLAGGAA